MAMGLAEDAFTLLRRIACSKANTWRRWLPSSAARTKLSPGVIKTLVRLAHTDGISMGEMARGIGCDPSYITALVDDLTERGLAARESDPVDRRVKIVVLTAEGRALAAEIDSVISVPPASFDALSRAELRQLSALLDKVVAADARLSVEGAPRGATLRATVS